MFNFEGGCYAKTINLRQDYEPLIWKSTRRFGTVLENLTIDQYSRRINYDDDSLTENTREAYPIGFLDNIVPSGRGGHPTNIFFLTADAFGVMPPIARLTPEQPMYYFLSGYTSKLAGTEKGVKEPQTTFSTCFGAPFLPLYPHVYANLLGEKIQKHKSNVWLINTGWTGVWFTEPLTGIRVIGLAESAISAQGLRYRSHDPGDQLSSFGPISILKQPLADQVAPHQVNCMANFCTWLERCPGTGSQS